MTLGVKLYNIFQYYQDQINFVLDVVYQIHYIIKDEFVETQEKLNSPDYREKYENYIRQLKWLNKQQNGMSIQLLDEYQEVDYLHRKIERSIPKSQHLMNMTHIYLMALFEGFNKQFFYRLLSNKPEIMKKKEKTISYEVLFRFNSYDDLYKYLAEIETDKFGWMDIDKFSKELSKGFNIQIDKEFKLWKDLREKYYRRNVIVHNNGKISELYIKKMNLPEEKLNQSLICDESYLIETNNCLKHYMTFIFNKIKEKFKLDTSGKRFSPFPINFNKPLKVKRGKGKRAK